ncbi:MAG TPA: sigma factor-like helix-turn-helix DNA-binding protein [Bryobacteraceae bacterium]|nr:sigma factor-like helix-turn-helix DNA-binding protein [Bryobacteraceae bacterium]
MLKRTSSPRTPLEDELIQLLDSHVPSARDRQVVRRVLGWDGLGGCLLAQAGAELGISRERARQVYSRAIGQIQTSELSSTLGQVLTFVQRRRNRSAEDIEAELQLHRFTRHRFGMQALYDTARALGRTPAFALEEAGGKLFVVARVGMVGSILKAALRSSSRYGIQTVAEMCSAIPPDCRSANDLLLVRQVLATRGDLRWLDASKQWFWLASVPRNPVVRCIKKVLQYAGSVRLADIQQASQRLPRKRKKPISREALIGFCQQASFCRFENGLVELVGSLGPTPLLSGAEVKVCRILQRNGNEMKFGCLEAQCAVAGVKKSNLWRIVQYSPLIFRPAPRLYALVTSRPNRAGTLNVRTA